MRTNYSIKNSITSVISNIVSYVFLFIGQSVFIKTLGIEYTGLNGLFSNILTILNLFELGIGSAITYNLYKCVAKNDKEKIKSLMLFYKKTYDLVAFIIFVIGIILIPFLKFIINDINLNINIYIVYLLFLLNTVVTYFISYKRTLLFSNQRNYIINIIHISYIIILNVLQIIILFITSNYYLYLIVKIICIVFENLVISIKTNKNYPYILEKNVKKIDVDTKNDIINRVKALFVHKLSGAVTNGTDNILISIFFGLKYVGLYTNYYYIISAIKFIFRDFLYSTTASVGNLLVEKNYDKNYITYKKIIFLNFWIAVFTSICLFLLIEPFITIWIGSKYILEFIILVSLILNYFQTMMRSTYIVFKDSAGIWVEDKYIPVIQIVLNIVFSIVFLKIFGLAGVFMGTIASSLILWLYSYPKFVYKKLFNRSYKDYFKGLLKSIFIFLMILIITYIISNLFVIKSSIIKLIVNGLICIIIPNLILYLLFRKTDEFRYYINLIKNILRRKKN